MNYQDFVSFLKELGLSEFGISVVIAVLIAVYILVKLFQFFFQNNQTRESKQFDILNKIIDDKEYLEKISSKPYLIRQLFFTRLYTLKRFQTYEIDFLLSELDMKINLYQLKTLK
ncbi:hypothetical protein, partial [Psychrobacter immobilis]|uniref:hypothetical protein n=1 Tax=Psychrobacter immobilis TaxID=498 RepID=UPI001D120E06